MATFNLSPKIYKLHKVNNQYFIDEIITSTSQVISNGGGTYEFLLEFDVSSVTSYGPNTNFKLKPTVDYVVSGGGAQVTASKCKDLSSDFTVGSQVVFTSSVSDVYYGDDLRGWTRDGYRNFRIYADRDDKIYLYSTVKAITLTDDHISDYEIKFHNMLMTFETGSDYAFTVTLDNGGGYHTHDTALTVAVNPVQTQAVKWYKVVSGTLYYKEETAGSYTSVVLADGSATIPAATFENGKKYKVYAEATSDAGTTASAPEITVSTIDGTATATPVSPNNQVTYGDLTFEWTYSVSTGEPQYAYDIQISADGETWTDVYQHVISDETDTAYTQTTAGATYWRIRAYNQNDVAGPWSSPLYYINNVPPQAPTIRSVSGTGRQTVSWETDQQQAYQVMVEDTDGNTVFDTGEVYSGEKTVLVNQYLQNGTYRFYVRIATGIGGWSEWANMQKTINAPLPSPQFTLTATDDGVQVAITADAAYDLFYVLRDGVLIGVTTDSFLDLFVSGAAEYEVIGVGSGDAYGYGIKATEFIPGHDRIATEDGEIILVNTRWNERSFPQRSLSPKFSAFEFLGEDRPVHIFADGFRKGSFTVAAYDESDDFKNLLTKRVYLNTTFGWGDWCVVTALNRAEGMWGNDTAISLDLTAPPEAIEYEV